MTVLNPGTWEGLINRGKVSLHSGDDSSKNIKNSFVEKLHGSIDKTLFFYWRVKCGQRWEIPLFLLILTYWHWWEAVYRGYESQKEKKTKTPFTQFFFYCGNITSLLQQVVTPPTPLCLQGQWREDFAVQMAKWNRVWPLNHVWYWPGLANICFIRR